MAQSISQEAIGATGLPGATAASRHAGATTSGAPTTGTFAVGDFIVDQSGAMWVCTVAGTPGTWQLSGVSVNENIAGKNFIINGGMDIWQRGTTGFTTNSAYTADRWVAGLNSGTFAVSQSTDVPTGFTYSLSLVGTTALNAQILTRIESANSTAFAGKTVTLSLWAKSTAGTSQLGYSNGYANSVNNFASQTGDTNGTFTSGAPSGSWTKYSATFTPNALAANGYQIIIYRAGTDTSTTLITGVQLEIAPQATPFSRAGGSIGGELLLCQRYFQHYGNGIAYEYYGVGSNITGSYAMVSLPLKVKMRATPSVTYSAASTFQIVAGSGGSYVVPTSLNVGAITADTLLTQLNYSSLTTGAGNFLQDYGYGTSSVNVSAEL